MLTKLENSDLQPMLFRQKKRLQARGVAAHQHCESQRCGYENCGMRCRLLLLKAPKILKRIPLMTSASRSRGKSKSRSGNRRCRQR
jgi:hypothetical protein